MTERCVFRLTPDGLELTEIGPGVDIDRDILAPMDFTPIINAPKTMDSRIFSPHPMGLREELLSLPIDQRLTYDPDRQVLFVNFEGLTVRSVEQVREIESKISGKLAPRICTGAARKRWTAWRTGPPTPLPRRSGRRRGPVARLVAGGTRPRTA